MATRLVAVRPFDKSWVQPGDAVDARVMTNFIKAAMFAAGPDGISEASLKAKVQEMVDESERARILAAAWECVENGVVAAGKGEDGEWWFQSMEDPPAEEVPS